MKTLLVAIVGNDNFGDEAMFKAIYRKLLSRGEEIVVATYNDSKYIGKILILICIDTFQRSEGF